MMRIIFLVVLVSLFAGCQSFDTPQILDSGGRVLAGSVSEIDRLDINGTKQFVMIRGRSADSPVVLRIHGGPGQAEIAAEVINRDLEKNFVVVEWDQRGAGKSVLDDSLYSSLTLDQIVDDTLALSRYLQKRFGKKILLLGHSWGSLVGLKAVKRSPELYAGFISTGQIVNYRTGMGITYDLLGRLANQQSNGAAVQALADLGRPPYTKSHSRQVFYDLIEKFGLDWHAKKSFDRVGLMLRSPEYSWSEKLSFTGEARRSFDVLLPDLMGADLESVTDFDVPVYFLLGRWDGMAPHELAEQYFETIHAPLKKILWFEDSAHFPQYEEPGKFGEAINSIWQEIRENSP
jgi:pimeloyl-ACP methyl ester carboxylesterase